MRKRALFVLAVGLFASWSFGLYGCAGIPKKEPIQNEEALLEPQATLKFSDIPVPAGFKFLSDESYSFESVGVRVGVLRYHGKADVEQVVNFYKDQMPLYNWNLLNSVEYGQRLLNFDREQESCIISLLHKGNSVSITISLGPKSALKIKKSEKPVK